MFVTLLYGVYTFISNSNPWTDYIMSYYASYDVSGVINEQVEYSNLTRKTQSTFVSTNCFGYYLTYMFSFLLLLKNKMSHIKWGMSLLLILVCMVFSTKRSPIVVLMFIVAYLVRYKKNDNSNYSCMWHTGDFVVYYTCFGECKNILYDSGILLG